jgi:hypothetical protein
MSEQPVQQNPRGSPIMGVLLVIAVLIVAVLAVAVGAQVWGAVMGFIVDLASLILVAIGRLIGTI